MDKGGLFLHGLVLQLMVQRLDLLLLLCNQLITLIHLQLSLELLLLEHEVILLDFVENLLSFLLPFEIKLLEIINLPNFVHFLQFVIFNLSVKDHKVNAALFHFLIVLAVSLPIIHVDALDLSIEFFTFDLIISNFLVCDS